jgi:molybdopterin converting factor small subunit
MKARVHLTGYLTDYADGAQTVELSLGDNAVVGDALNELWRRYVGLRDRVITEQGQLRQHVLLVVGNDLMDRNNLRAPLREGDEISILPAVTGG